MADVLIERRGNFERFHDPETGKFKLNVYAANRFGEKAVLRGNEMLIEHPRITAIGERGANGLDLGPAVQTFTVERFEAGAWVALPTTLKGNDLVARIWQFDNLDVHFSEAGKWTYTLTAPRAGRYRLVSRFALKAAHPFVVHRMSAHKDPAQREYRAAWGRFSFNWRDMLDDVAELDADEGGLVLRTVETTLAARQSVSFDPSIGLDSTWGADIDANGDKFPDDGDDWLGGTGGGATRVPNVFDITSLPAAAVVDQVDFEITVQATVSAGSLFWDIGPYNGTGIGDPEADAGTTAYARCDVSADLYVEDTTAFRSAGTKTFSDLGAAAEADVEAARDAGTIFTIACKETTDIETNNRAVMEEYTHPSTPPKLTITYTLAVDFTQASFRHRNDNGPLGEPL